VRRRARLAHPWEAEGAVAVVADGDVAVEHDLALRVELVEVRRAPAPADHEVAVREALHVPLARAVQSARRALQAARKLDGMALHAERDPAGRPAWVRRGAVVEDRDA